MWSPSCILEQSRFQPAIVCKTRVLLIASATVRFIGVAILWVPIASAPAAPRSRTPTPPAPPAEIRFIGHTAWRRRCDRHSPRGVFFDGTVLFPAELPAIDCRRTADMASRPAIERATALG